MPGIATHYVFGTDAYRAAEQAIGDRPEGLAAFLLGNHAITATAAPAQQRNRASA